ncbi:helicase [Aureococcus anophagefferens]|nr:helicase [Aureococcus anophagefferens]
MEPQDGGGPEEERVNELLAKGAEDEEGSDSLLEQSSRPAAKKAQLDTLLAKAEQYSAFIVNSQMSAAQPEPEPEAGSKRKSTSGGGSSKKKKKGEAGDAAAEMAEAQAKMKGDRNLVQQPTGMTGGTLKPYQVEGLRWLATLFENGLSGILADEMGLGKTIQVIALIAHIREKNVKGPICVAAPLATLPNWMNEFKKWVPGISALLYHGSKQHRADLRKTAMATSLQNEEDFPVIVTSYEVCIIDRAPLSHFKFKYLIIDEGQRVKNRDCRLVRELKKLNTENRLLLSGTPIQNTLEELWSLLNFVNPQIFDDLNVFQSWFGFRNIGQETQVDDIIDDESKDRIVTKLHEILRPFLLRRVKSDVLRGVLPDKKEIVLKDSLIAAGIPATSHEVSEQNMLMNQRKNANHPFLFGEPRDANGEFIGVATPKALVNAAGKFRLLERILPKLKAQGHKVLLFSQMTELLNIIEDYLRWRDAEIGMMEKQISKKKLERMAVQGGDYNKAGRRSRGELTTDALRSLLDDDVNIAQRIGAAGDNATADEISEQELDLVMDRAKIFSPAGIPTEGKMYDVVSSQAGPGLLSNLDT